MKIKRERTRLYQAPMAEEPVKRPVAGTPILKKSAAVTVAPARDRKTPSNGEATRRQARAEKVVEESVFWAAGAGFFVPAVALDTIAVAGVQLWMLSRLADVYGVSYRRDIGKSCLATLLGGLPVAKSSILKIIPILGTITGAVAVSTVAAASTYAVGKIFIQHFETGGTMLTLDPEQMKEYFSREMSGRDDARSAR